MARKLEVEIIGDSRSLERAFGRSSSAGSNFGRKIGGISKTAAIGLGGLAVAGGFLGKKMISLASDAGEVESKFKVIFGKEMPGMVKQIDAFSKATGASRFELREQVADMGALLEPLTATKKEAGQMSLQFTKLATDLGSFNNVPTADALLAIRSGLVGEAEPLRRFGVLLNEAAVKQEALRLGLVKGKQELTEQQKVQARASLIMQQTTLAQGDAERTAGSFANQIKALKNGLTDMGTEIGIVLLPHVLKLVTFINQNMPTIKAVTEGAIKGIVAAIEFLAPIIAKVIGWFKMLADFARRHWDEVQAAADRVVKWYRGTLAPAIQNILTAIQAFWDRFGKAITKIVVTAFRQVFTIISTVLKNISSIVNAFMAILRGDWSTAWKELKEIPGRTLRAIVSLLKGMATIFLTAAQAIGKAIIDGILAGVSGLGEALADKLKGAVSSAMDSVKGFLHVGSPSKLTRDEIGKPIGEGVTEGAVEGTDKLGAKLKAKLSEQLRQAAEDVKSAKADFASAFSDLANEALSAFDAAMSQWQPKAQIRLDELHAKEQLAQLKSDIKTAAADVAAAQGELQKALAGGDPEEIRSAQQAVTDALAKQLAARRAMRDYNLEQEAKDQQEAHDKETARERIRFANQLTALQQAYGNQEITTKEFHKRLNKLLAQHGVDQEFYGTAMGIQFANGIQKSTQAVVNAITRLLKRIERLMKLRSPAEEGPLSDLDKWWEPLFDTLLSGVDLNQIKKFGTAVGNTLSNSLRGGAGNASFGLSLIDWMRGVKSAAPSTAGAFDEVGKAKDALGENVKEFSAESETNFNKVTDAVTKMSSRSRTVLPEIAKVLGKTLRDSSDPLMGMAGLFDLVTEAVRGLRYRLYELRDGARDTIPEIVSLLGGGSISAAVATLKGRASGGPVRSGQAYVVGEMGPELFVPNRSGQIIANRSSGGVSAGGVTVNVYGNLLTSKRELEDMVRSALYNVNRRNPGATPGVA